MFFFPRDIVRVRKIRFLLEGKSYYTRCVNSIDCCVLKIPNWLTLDRLYVNFYDLLRNDRQFIWTEIGFRYDKIKNTILLFSHIGISWFKKIWKLQNTIYTSYKHCLSKLLKSPQSSTRTHKTNRRSERSIILIRWTTPKTNTDFHFTKVQNTVSEDIIKKVPRSRTWNGCFPSLLGASLSAMVSVFPLRASCI